MKQSIYALAIILLIFGSTACNSHIGNKSVKSDNTELFVDSSGQHIQRKLDTNLSVDADVTAPSNIQRLNTFLVIPVKIDNKTLETLLIANSKITHIDDYGDKGSSSLTEDGKELFIGNGIVNFQTDKFRKYVYQLLSAYKDAGDPFFNLDQFSQERDQDLSFMPHRQAVDEVKKNLTSLGISVYDKVETYSLNYKTLQTQEKALKDNGSLTSPKDGRITQKDGWSEEDDCYYMILRSGFNEIPVYSMDNGNVEINTIVAGTYIFACYSKKGFEYLSINNPYQKKTTDQVGLKIISAEEALTAVKRKYGNVILTNSTTINAIELNYVRTLINRSRDEFRIVPAWCFELKSVNIDGKGELRTVHSRVIIDATNGGEIL